MRIVDSRLVGFPLSTPLPLNTANTIREKNIYGTARLLFSVSMFQALHFMVQGFFMLKNKLAGGKTQMIQKYFKKAVALIMVVTPTQMRSSFPS